MKDKKREHYTVTGKETRLEVINAALVDARNNFGMLNYTRVGKLIDQYLGQWEERKPK